MADRKLFVGLPIYGPIDPHFFRSIMRFTQENTLPAIMSDVVGDSHINRARNNLTRQFLESGCSDFLMIDTDLIFSAEQVKRMFEFNLPVIGGLYPKKQQGELQWVLNTLDDPAKSKDNGLIEVKYIGTGFIMIQRHVFEAMISAIGHEMIYTLDADQKTQEYNFWHAGCYEFPNGYRRWLSEDWWFCQMWRDLGGKIFADQKVVLKHSGGAIYPLDHQEKEMLSRQNPNASDHCPEPMSVLRRGMTPGVTVT